MVEIHNSCGKLASGLSAIPSGLEGTSIMHCVDMVGKGVWSLTKKKSWLMDTIPRLQQSMDASGMVVLASRDLPMKVSEDPEPREPNPKFGV